MDDSILKIGNVAQVLMASLQEDEDLRDGGVVVDVAIVACVQVPPGHHDDDVGNGTYWYRVAGSSKFNHVKLGLFAQAVRACEDGEDLEEPEGPQ